MKIDNFIKRPVLASGISILIVILGIIGLTTMPVEQYPDVAPPTVSVYAYYPGANAETVLKSVVTPLEESINGVENMMYMTSSASASGEVRTTVYFRPGTDPDMAAVNVQNRVATASGLLPAEVNRTGVTTRKQQNSLLMSFVLYTPDDSFDREFLANYLKINVQPALMRIQGVGNVNAMGMDYSMRIWLKPDVMAQYKLVPSDIVAVLGEQNIEVATGELGENSDNTFQYTMKYTGRLETEEQFGDMVVRALPDGEVLLLKDVATLELGSANYMFIGETNNHASLFCMVYQTPGSNATQIIKDIEAHLAEAEKDLPKGMAFLTIQNNNDFLFASINNVVQTLVEAILLVVLVVFFFLQNFRSTLIPTISILVSLIGTFAVLSVAGFTINLLTLFALVLVIGTVVDDSIVVVEAVQAKFDAGYKSAYLAARDGMKGITNAIVVSSLVFMAVFIPVCFISGTSGTFYTQFGITMAVAVGISAINALTLCPALCALLMKPGGAEKGFTKRVRKAYEASYGAFLKEYKTGAMFFIRRKWLAIGCVAVGVAALVLLMNTTKTGFIPDEDTGVIYVDVSAALGNTINSTLKVQRQIAEQLEQMPQIESFSHVVGYGIFSGQGSSYGNWFIRLKPWSDRPGKENSVEAVVAEINARLATVKDATALAFAPPMLPGYGMSNGIELHMQDRTGGTVADFFQVTQDYLTKLRERPEIEMAYSTFNPTFPQYQVEVDAAKCKRAGVSPNEVLEVLGGYTGGLYASNFNRFTKVYRVMVQAAPEYRLDEQSLNNMYVRINDEMAPISQFVTLTKIYGAQSLYRFNLFNSIAVSGQPADGYSTGDAIRAIQEVASENLPHGYSYEFGSMTREQNENTNTTVIIFALCIVFIYLLLSMLYESYLIPFAVLLSVPFGLVGSFLFAKIAGMENNIYLQTGLIMLIGLLAKTAILLTEFASERRREGMSIVRAAMSAAKERLRPILMTVLTMVFGMLPMMLASGVGANGSRSLGAGVVGGMVVGTIALLFIVPALFTVFQTLQEKFKKPEAQLLEETNDNK